MPTPKEQALDAIARGENSLVHGTPLPQPPALNVSMLEVSDNIRAAIVSRVGQTPPYESSSSQSGGTMPYKHTWVFFDQVGATWSEVYTCNVGSSAAASLNGITQDLINLRLAFLYGGCKLRTIRATEIGGARTTDFRNFNSPGLVPISGASPDVTAVAAVWRLRGTTGPSRFVWFRGLSDNATTRQSDSGTDTLSAGARTAMEAWIKAAGEFGYGVMGRDKPDVSANTDYRYIAGIDGTAGDGSTLLTVSDPTGYTKGKFINVSKVDQKLLPGLKGLFKIILAVGTSIQIEYRTPGNANFATVGGRVRLITPGQVNAFVLGRCEFDHAGTRQTKSLFTRSRGAQSAQRLRNLV